EIRRQRLMCIRDSYQLSYSRKFVAVVIRISASLREAHYTRNPFSCKPLNAFFRDFCLNAD
ncbi:hypothetical protein, partial [Salmonella enterica]|uniref:hypothetical protein n=1 Tax=Salmonella enterica TaxID=28901 RepID=UPI001C3E8D56